MKTLILFGTKHGCTEKRANELAEKLEGEIMVHNIKNGPVKNLDAFDQFVIGSSVYAGMIRKDIKAFCKKNHELLMNKKIGFFICGMSEGEEAEKLLNVVFDADLLAHAAAKGCFGGEIIINNMGFFEKAILKKVAKLENDHNNVSQDAVNLFATEFNNA